MGLSASWRPDGGCHGFEVLKVSLGDISLPIRNFLLKSCYAVDQPLDSLSSRLYLSRCFSRSAGGLRIRTPVPFVPVERSLRTSVPLFAPLRDKVTSSAQYTGPFRPGPQSRIEPVNRKGTS